MHTFRPFTSLLILLVLACAPKQKSAPVIVTSPPPASDLPTLVLVRDADDPEGHIVVRAEVVGGLASPLFAGSLPVQVSVPDGEYPVEPHLPGVGACGVRSGSVMVSYFPTLTREPVDANVSCSAVGEVFVRFRIVGPRSAP